MAEMFTKSQTGYLDEYWGLDSSGNCWSASAAIHRKRHRREGSDIQVMLAGNGCFATR